MHRPEWLNFSGARLAILAVILGILLGAIWMGLEMMPAGANSSARAAAASPGLFSTPHVLNLLQGQVAVPAGNITFFRFVVTPEMQNVSVSGHFQATGGTGNDIMAVIADADNFENWKNGHAANGLYSTEKTTDGTIDVAITQPGTYYLAFSNKFSLFTPKTVTGSVALHYSAL